MIKRVFLVGIIIATLFGVCILVKRPIIHYIRVKQIESDILNFLNKKDDKHISEEGKIIYNYIANVRNSECNVSAIVGYYLDVVDEILQSRVYNRDIQNVKFPQDDNIDIYVNKVKVAWAGSVHKIEDFKEIQNIINDKAIKNYNYNTFRIELSKKLEKVLNHKSKDINRDWYMDVSKNKNIELPYGMYIKYNEGGKIDFDKTEHIYLNSKFIKCELEKSDVNFDFNNSGLTAKIIYKDKEGSIDNIWAVIGFKNKGIYIELTPNLKVAYLDYGRSGYSSVELKSHDVDREKERKRWYGQQVTDVGRMLDEGISMEIVERTEKIYNNNTGTDKAHRIIYAIECDFFDYVEEGFSKEEANVKIIDNWYYDNERKVNATIDIKDMLYWKGVKNKEIIEKVKIYYDSDLPLEEIRERIESIVQQYREYIDKHGLDKESACQYILNNWIYD